MGWSGGSDVMSDIARLAMRYVPLVYRADFYREVVSTLEECDWDTLDECLGIDPILDEVLGIDKIED